MKAWSRRRSATSLCAAGAIALSLAGCGQEATAPEAGTLGAVSESRKTAFLLAQSDFCDDALSATCTPTGAHGKIAVGFQPVHAGYDCKVCHYVGGRLAFQPNGPAFLKPVGPSNPRPYFDATAKTCSNVACHTVPAGKFTYPFQDGDGGVVWNTVDYGGGTPRPTPSWYSTGQGCFSCHGSPPLYNGAPYAWHSGSHGAGPSQNTCQFCHPDVVSTFVADPRGWAGYGGTWTNIGMSTATNCTVNGVPNQPCSGLHANGAINLSAVFVSSCFNCH